MKDRFVLTECSWVKFEERKVLKKSKALDERRKREIQRDFRRPTNNYAAILEKLALKKSSNNELFEHIKNTFDEELNDREFKLMNIEKNFTKDGHPIPHKTLDTSIERLRKKYKALKQEWSKIITRIKSASGLSPEKEPIWFKHLDPVFCETNEEMKLTSSATKTSFLNEQDGEYEEERNGEEDVFSGADDMDENNELESEIEASNEIKYCERHFRR